MVSDNIKYIPVLQQGEFDLKAVTMAGGRWSLAHWLDGLQVRSTQLRNVNSGTCQAFGNKKIVMYT